MSDRISYATLSKNFIEHPGLTHLLRRQAELVRLIVTQLSMKPGWWDAPLAPRDLTEAT